MYVRMKQYSGRGIFTKFLSRTLRKVSSPAVRKIAKKVVTNPKLQKAVKAIVKNKNVQNIAKKGIEVAADRVLSGNTPIKKSDKPKIIKAITETALDLPEVKSITNKTLKKDPKIQKTLKNINFLFSKGGSKTPKNQSKKKTRTLQNIKPKSSRGWRKIAVGEGFTLD